MKTWTQGWLSLGLAGAALLGGIGCGDSGNSGMDSLAGAGPFAGIYDMIFAAVVDFTSPADWADQSYEYSAVFTLADGEASDILLTGVSLRTGGTCTISLDRTAESAARIVDNQSCTGLFDPGTFRTATIAGTIAIAGNTLTGEVNGDVSGSIADNAYTGAYQGTWQGTKRP